MIDTQDLKFGKEKTSLEQTGIVIGFLLGYSMFTTVWYFVLYHTKRIPSDWSILNIVLITGLIVLFGFYLKKELK